MLYTSYQVLRDSGYGGLWNVGKAAIDPPRLVVLSYSPSGMLYVTYFILYTLYFILQYDL